MITSRFYQSRFGINHLLAMIYLAAINYQNPLLTNLVAFVSSQTVKFFIHVGTFTSKYEIVLLNHHWLWNHLLHVFIIGTSSCPFPHILAYYSWKMESWILWPSHDLVLIRIVFNIKVKMCNWLLVLKFKRNWVLINFHLNLRPLKLIYFPKWVIINGIDLWILCRYSFFRQFVYLELSFHTHLIN